MRHILLSLFSLALLLALPQSASACSCGPRPTVLDEFDHSAEVVILRAISVEKVAQKSEKDEPTHYYPYDVRSTTMIVEKVFKGTLKVRDEIVLGQGSGANCVWTFDEKSVGRQYLFYLNRPAGKAYYPHDDPKMWYAGECGRSTGLGGASENLLYLENLRKVRGKTRISGTLVGGLFEPELDVEGKKIKIIGPKKTYELKTDQNGVFEIYDVPPGKYFIEPEAPAGWKINPFWLSYSSNVVRSQMDQPEMKSPKQFAIMLEPKKHASVGIHFEIDNYVRGRVIGPKGKPMSDICVYLLLPGKDWGPSGCTDEQGRFEISSVAEGEWVLAANQDDKASSRKPFRVIFYPGVTDRERATVISIGPGDVIENIDLVIPKLEETITVNGVLQYSDGKPVVEEWVEFKATKKNDKAGDEERAKSDEAGRFTLTILRGLTGEMAGEYWLHQGDYKNCPKVGEILAQSGGKSVTVRTNVVTLTTEQNIYDLELTFPFPRCEKAKE